MSSLSFIYLLF